MADDFRIFPLGVDALTIEFGQVISERLNDRVIELDRQLRSQSFAGLIETVPAYSSLTVFYDPSEWRGSAATAFESVAAAVASCAAGIDDDPAKAGRLVEIPAEFNGEDLAEMSDHLRLAPDEIVRIFLERTYRVFMIGFLPGFAYMGEIDARIAMPRRPTPRTHVGKGSIGIAGRQTGIYPFDSPGGWQIIGSTKVEMFDPYSDPPSLLAPGDRVRFVVA